MKNSKLVALVILWGVFAAILNLINIPFPYNLLGSLIMACLAVLWGKY